MPRRNLLLTPIILVSLFVTLLPGAAQAEEGMFPISDIARLNLQQYGLQLTAADIFNADQTCLVDGICRVNGCTGSFVSPQGLIITNHHCAFRAIQSLSTPEHDYVRDGFQSRTPGEELPARGYTVRITESFRDVSAEVLNTISDTLPFFERTQAIEKRRKELEQAAEQQHPGLRAEVAEMFTGRTYVLFLYTYLRDVRLVFAPPASVGAFGGEIDNWEWPRHTGDFSFMRAYTAPDGSPADYAANNIPYRPRRVLQVNPQGLRENDFVMLLGYPARTVRHRTSQFLLYEQQVRLPFVVQSHAWEIQTLEEAGRHDRAVALKYANRIKSLGNVEKRSRGQLQGLRRRPIVQSRIAAEQELQARIAANPDWQHQYGHVLQELGMVYQDMTSTAAAELRLQQLRTSCLLLSVAFTLYDAAVERSKPDLERETPYMDRNFDQTRQQLLLTQQDLHLPTDRLVLQGLLQQLAEVPELNRLPALQPLLNGANAAEHIEALYAGTRLHEPQFVNECLQKSPEELEALLEPALQLLIQLYPEYVQLRQTEKRRDGQLGRLYSLLLDVKQAVQQSAFVPDANATLRLTHGKVQGYSPQDAVYKSPFTTLRGLVEKTTGTEPFETPQRILEMYAAGDFGPFAHPDLQQVPVAVLYSTDTTGGNSGSPILDNLGRLVGVNFDRTFEATINDFAWDPQLSRSLGVDIRYVLWITGQVYNAGHLLEEMGVTASGAQTR